VTAASAGAGEPRAYRFVMWLAHRQPHALAALIATDAAQRVALAYRPDTLLYWALTVASALALAAVIGAIFANRRHDATLCTRCARKTPLDGPAAAAEHDRALRLYHRLADRPGLLLVGLVAVSVRGSWLLPPLWRILTGAVVWGTFAVEAAAALRHRPLQPWCPYCHRWDDGGDEEPSPTPPPVREATR